MAYEAVSVGEGLPQGIASSPWEEPRRQQSFGVPSGFWKERKLMGQIAVSIKPVEDESEQPAFIVQFGRGKDRRLGPASVKKFYNSPEHCPVSVV